MEGKDAQRRGMREGDEGVKGRRDRQLRGCEHVTGSGIDKCEKLSALSASICGLPI